jgi:hypothetical protein
VAETFKFGWLTAGGPSSVAVWEAGETTRIVVTGYKIDFTNDVAGDTAGYLNFFLDIQTYGGYQFLATSAYLPDAGGHKIGAYSTGWIDLGTGIDFGSQAEVIELQTGAGPALAAGQISVVLRGYEVEAGYPAPEVDTVTPIFLPTTGGITVTLGGSWLRELTALTVAGVPCAPTTVGDDGEQVVFASPVHAASTGPSDAYPFALTTTGGTLNTIPVFSFYDPELIAHITELDPTSIGVLAGTDPITATGSGFDYFGGVTKVGFFTSDHGDTIPTTPPTGYALATVIDDGELTFTCGGIPPGTYYVIPGLPGAWLGTSAAQITITP